MSFREVMEIEFPLASIKVGNPNRDVHGLTQCNDLDLLYLLVQRLNLAAHKRLYSLSLGLKEGSIEFRLLLKVAGAHEPCEHDDGVGARELTEIAFQLLLRHAALLDVRDPEQRFLVEHLDRVLLIPARPVWFCHPPVVVLQRLPHPPRLVRLPQRRLVDCKHVGAIEAVPVPSHDPHRPMGRLYLPEFAQEDLVVIPGRIESLQG
mmetsp:Transcript_32357/g.72677  ORF Transcript_32357/g.72677 Transcript_32357/m.72677 type:complete len:206 (+) Transcript_32357:129-746(+)